MGTESNESFVGTSLNTSVEASSSLRDQLLTIPKPPIAIDEPRRGRFAKLLIGTVNFGAVMLIVTSPLSIAYLLGKEDTVGLLVIPVSIVSSIVVFAFAILLADYFMQRESGSRAFAEGNYFTHWQIDAQQQVRVRQHLRSQMWKQSLFVIGVLGLPGLGLGLAEGSDATRNSGQHHVWIYGVGGMLLSGGIGTLVAAYIQWQARKRNGIGQLPNADVFIGPAGLYLAGEHTPLDSLNRILIDDSRPGELQFEFLSSQRTPVPFPAEHADVATALMSLLNKQDIASLGLLAMNRSGGTEPDGSVSTSAVDSSQLQPTDADPTDHYSYKVTASTPATTLRLTEDSLELLDGQLKVIRQIQYSLIESMHEYDGVGAVDPKTGPYTTKFCRLRLTKGKSLNVRNGIYISPDGRIGEISANRNDRFQRFMLELKRRVAAINPQTPVMTGWRGLAQMFGLVAAFFMIVLVLLLIGMRNANEFPSPLGVLGFCILFGIPVFGSLYVTRLYWPRSRPVIDDVNDLPR